MRHLIFIRHGETEGNRLNKGPLEGHIIAGQFDMALTSRGQQQARNVGKELRSMTLHLSRFVSSDLPRAATTSKLIAAELQTQVPIEHSPLLRERYVGAFEGRKIIELQNEYQEYFSDPAKRKWRADFVERAPGGENFTEVTNRITPLLDELTNFATGDVIVVSHIRVICCAIGRILKLPNHQTVALKIPNCEPLIIRIEHPNEVAAVDKLQLILAATETQPKFDL